MAEKAIPLIPNQIYHIYHHANGDDLLFREAENYYFFLSKIEKYIHPISKIYAYCLMPNHFHFLLRVKAGEELKQFFNEFKNPRNAGRLRGLETDIDFSSNVSKQFKSCLISYSKAFNKFYGRKGSLFAENLKRIEISNEEYLTNMIRYIHFNPVLHGFARRASEWRYSSYWVYFSNNRSLLERTEVYQWFGGVDEFKDFYRAIQKDEFNEIVQLTYE